MDEIIKALAINIPAAAAVIATVYMFLGSIKENAERRDQNAKEMALENRDHEIRVQKMWSDNIKIMLAKQDETFELIAQKLEDHEKKSQERYTKQNITQELIDAVKDKTNREGKS